MNIEMTRARGLGALQAAIPMLGRRYAEHRNTESAPDQLATTTRLSPYLRRRLVLEEEVVRAAWDAHGPAAEKFIQEVFWRTYFKGHLETRPWLWTDYQAELAREQARLADQPGLRRAFEQAVLGRTGIDGFDDWARALAEEGWLHNHARMWFASIWIFTLRLPWVLGADFFARNLIDFDPASNTLGWRWVAGLHTRGKHYVARAENIRRYTEGRYDPRGLDESPEPLSEPEGRAAVALPPADDAPAGEVTLLLHLDDLAPETLASGTLAPGGARVVRICPMPAGISDRSALVQRADEAAMADGVARACAHFGCESGEAQGGTLMGAWAPVGPSGDALPGFVRIRRAWDEAVWPRSTKGFFKVKQAIPAILRESA